MLRKLDENLWIAEMPASRAGFEFGARTTVVKLQSGALWIHSPIELTGELKTQLDEIGEVGFVVSPSRFHYLHLKDFAAAYPSAKYYCAPKFNVQTLPEVSFAAKLKSRPEAEWEDDFEQLQVRGSALYDEVEFFHAATRTLILTDLCLNIPSSRGASTRVMAKALGVLDHFGPSPSLRMTTRSSRLLRETVEEILQWDFDRVIISHGEIIESGGKEALRQAFASLLEE